MVKLQWVSQRTLYIFTFTIPPYAANKVSSDFLVKVSILSKTQPFKNLVYLYQPNSMM